MAEEQFGFNNKPDNLNKINAADVPVPLPSPNKSIWRWAVLAVLAVLAVCSFLFWLKEHKLPGNTAADNSKIVKSILPLPAGYKAVPVTAGQFPSGFPKELVLEKNVKPVSGEDTIDGTGANQKIVEYYSSSTPTAISKLYSDGLPKDKWAVVSQFTKDGVITLQFNSKDNLTTFMVTALPKAGGSQVTLAYVISKKQ